MKKITYEKLYEKNCENKLEILNEVNSSGEIKSFTYKEILERVENLFKKFKKNLSSGDKCLVCTKDGFDFLTYYLLIFKVKATCILVDKDISKKETDDIVKKVKPTIILCDTNHYDLFVDKANTLININTDDIKINKDIEKILDNNSEAQTVIFSSGTTSNKSGILHETSNFYDMIYYTEERFKTIEGEKFITIVPNSHIYGLALNTIFNTYVPTKIYYLETLDIKVLMKLLTDVKPEYLCGVTKFYELIASMLMTKIGAKKFLVSLCFFIRKNFGINLGKKLFKKVFETFNDVCFITAGAPLDDSTEKFLFGLGFPLIEFYGLTETNVPIITTVDKNKYTYGIGKVLEPNKIKVKDKTHELLVKNDYMLTKYIYNGSKDKKLLDDDGYINTGDVVKVTKKGIYILGRTKETIILSTGEKISPDDVEACYKNLHVKDFAVCGIPEKPKSKSDKIHMFIVKNKGQKEEDIIKEVHDISHTLDVNMKIFKIHFVRKIPRTSIGKARRFLLKKQLLVYGTIK